MKPKNTSHTARGIKEYLEDILPEIRDEIGNAIAQLLSGPNRKENREELKRTLAAIKEMICDAAPPDNLIDDLNMAFDKFEESIGEMLGKAEKSIKWARIMAVSWVLALGAMLLDRRWKSIFEAIF